MLYWQDRVVGRQPKSFSLNIGNNTISYNLPFKYIDYVKAHKKIAPITSRIIARTFIEAERRINRHRTFLKRMEDARTSSMQRLNDLPKNATIRKEYVKCGKDTCEMSHGPYYYAYWKEKITDNYAGGPVWRLKKKYVGSFLPADKVSKS